MDYISRNDADEYVELDWFSSEWIGGFYLAYDSCLKIDGS
jgi:hypothetical protein